MLQTTFQDLINFSNEENIQLHPQFILTDFEKAAINAAQTEFPGVQNKGCHFHLAQNVYRKIQAHGLSTQYGTDENFSLLIRHIPALAFLAPDAIPAAFDQLRDNIPEEAGGIIQWFDNNYVNGKLRRTLRDGSKFESHHYFRLSSGQWLTILSMHSLVLQIL